MVYSLYDRLIWKKPKHVSRKTFTREFLQAINYFWKVEGGLFTIVSRLTAWVDLPFPCHYFTKHLIKEGKCLGLFIKKKNVYERQLLNSVGFLWMSTVNSSTAERYVVGISPCKKPLPCVFDGACPANDLFIFFLFHFHCSYIVTW